MASPFIKDNPDLDFDPSPSTPTKKRKAPSTSTTSSPNKRSPAKSKSNNNSTVFYGEDKRTGPWTPSEDKTLFQVLYPKLKGVNWDVVARSVPGRDIKSCQNREAALRKKVAEFFSGP